MFYKGFDFLKFLAFLIFLCLNNLLILNEGIQSMLNYSFLHISSIGRKTEEKIWESGIRTTEEFVKSQTNSIPPSTREKIINHINMSGSNAEDPYHYYNHLPSSEQWRIFKRFQKYTAYIDIETTKLDTYRDKITTIALYPGFPKRCNDETGISC